MNLTRTGHYLVHTMRKKTQSLLEKILPGTYIYWLLVSYTSS